MSREWRGRMNSVARAPAAARSHADGEHGRRPGGTALYPLEPVAEPGAKAARAWSRAGFAGRIFHHGRAPREGSTGADRCLRSGLCHCDACDRLHYCGPAVRAVLYPAFTCTPRDLKRISLHSAYVNSLDADLSGRVRAKWPPWRRAPEHGVA